MRKQAKAKRKIRKIYINKAKFKRNIRFLVSLIILVSLTICSVKLYKKFVSEKLDITVSITNNQASLTMEQRKPIEEFFTLKAKALARLEQRDIGNLFSKENLNSYENAKLNQLALDINLMARTSSFADLSYKKALFNYEVNSVEENEDGSLSVGLTENHEIIFACLDEQKSYSCGILHKLVLIKKDTVWLISSHTGEDDFSSAEAIYSEERGEEKVSSSTECDILINTAYELAKQEITTFAGVYNSKRQSYIANPDSFIYTLLTDKPLDRQAAVSYAMQYSGETSPERNPKWNIYDELGGNCNNFISQCLYAGGMDFDISGDYQWKHYSDALNEGGGAWGRSPSWTSVEHFYKYCSKNKGAGISAKVGLNYYCAEEGDILQLGSGGEWVHSVIITGIIKDDDGNICDYAICSNTLDRKNYPISAYGSLYSLRLIKIYGSNN